MPSEKTGLRMCTSESRASCATPTTFSATSTTSETAVRNTAGPETTPWVTTPATRRAIASVWRAGRETTVLSVSVQLQGPIISHEGSRFYFIDKPGPQGREVSIITKIYSKHIHGIWRKYRPFQRNVSVYTCYCLMRCQHFQQAAPPKNGKKYICRKYIHAYTTGAYTMQLIYCAQYYMNICAGV